MINYFGGSICGKLLEAVAFKCCGVTTSVGLKELVSSGAIVVSFCGVILATPLQSSYTQNVCLELIHSIITNQTLNI